MAWTGTNCNHASFHGRRKLDGESNDISDKDPDEEDDEDKEMKEDSSILMMDGKGIKQWIDAEYGAGQDSSTTAQIKV